MPVNTDEIIAKANELNKARELVARLEAELRILVMGGDDSSPFPSVPSLQRLSDLALAAPISDRILALLEGSSDRPFYFKEIYKTVGGNEASVRSTIAKLINEKKIERMEWGKYRALQKERLKAG